MVLPSGELEASGCSMGGWHAPKLATSESETSESDGQTAECFTVRERCALGSRARQRHNIGHANNAFVL
jgi:hypothetical protein